MFVCERGADLVDEKMKGYLFACVLRGVARHEEVIKSFQGARAERVQV